MTTVLVTHDQQEALDIADSIAVLNKGRIEQVGAPIDLYDNPSNEFVFSFLGSVSWVNGQVVRPHDLRLERVRCDGALVAEVVRVVFLGFEVRVELREPGSDDVFVAEITRGDAAALRLDVGDEIYVRPLRIADVEVADVEAALAEQTSVGDRLICLRWPSGRCRSARST